MFIVTVWFIPMTFSAPLYIIAFAVLGSAILGTLGLIAGIWAEKFDQLAAFQNFLIMPLTFLSGVFYSTHTLPPVWREVSRLNPFFYMIDGFRYGFFGMSDVSPLASLGIVAAFFAVLAVIAVRLLAQRLQAASLNIKELPMLPTPEQVKNYIAGGLACQHLEVEGDGQHFFATIVSELRGQAPDPRHQMVYAALGDRMRAEIHALSMKTLTPAEWQTA